MLSRLLLLLLKVIVICFVIALMAILGAAPLFIIQEGLAVVTENGNQAVLIKHLQLQFSMDQATYDRSIKT